MIQVWLTLIAMFLWQASRDAKKLTVAGSCQMAAFGAVIASIILAFVNHGVG